MSAGFCSVSTGCRGFRKALANGFLNVPFEGPRKGNITLFVLIRFLYQQFEAELLWVCKRDH